MKRPPSEAGSDRQPFLAAIGLFLMSFIGIAISLWPMIVPYHYTLWQAASSQSTQAFLLIGTLFLAAHYPDVHRLVVLDIPGKVREGEAYH